MEELRKLIPLLENNEIKLHLTEQVKHEFYRNRENKIKDALKALSDEKAGVRFPQFCKEYPEYDTLKKLIADFDKKKKTLMEKMKGDISNERLKADNIIKQLFNLAQLIESRDFYDDAIQRHNLGDPPGKSGSYGDAINWVSLLNSVPKNNDLYFVAQDKDYVSLLDKDKFNAYLSKEWTKKKESNIIYYKQLSDFFKNMFPAIKLADEYKKYKTITELEQSISFNQTHDLVAKLSHFSDFVPDEVNRIIKAATENNQIYWIATDSDIRRVLWKIVKDYKNNISRDLLHAFHEKFSEQENLDVEELEEDDLPF